MLKFFVVISDTIKGIDVIKKKKSCYDCAALSGDFKCELHYVTHITIINIGKEITTVIPDEPCPKPKTPIEYEYWKTKGKIDDMPMRE